MGGFWEIFSFANSFVNQVFLHHPTPNQIMPLTAAQLTRFWTHQDEIGLSACTRGQMAIEGLAIPEDFNDFVKKSHLEALIKTLLKPAKIPVGPPAIGALREVEAYTVTAKSMIRLDGARQAVRYYRLVGRPITADDVSWPIVKGLVEHWTALMEKKQSDVGQPPKLTKEKPIYKWLESLDQYLSDKIGVRDTPLQYLTRENVGVPAILPPRAVGQPYSEGYESIEDELVERLSHTDNLFKSDNNALFQIVDRSVQGHEVSATIAPFRRTQNGRGAVLAIQNQHAGNHVWDAMVLDATAILNNRKWDGKSSITLLQHTSAHRKAFISLTEAAQRTAEDVPGARQRMTFLLDSIVTENPKVLATVALIQQDTNGMRINFEDAVTFLLPTCPVKHKDKTKNVGASVSSVGASGSTAAPAGNKPHPMGKTGVELRWYADNTFSKLTKEQRTEVSQWVKANNARGGKSAGDKTGNKRKGRVSSAEAYNTKVIKAMAESQAASLASMQATIAASGGTAITPSGGLSTTPATPPDTSVTPAVYAERARVAAVTLEGILKNGPSSGKGKKKGPPTFAP